MALTVAEAMFKLERLKHTRAIWQETAEHLSKFVDKEVRPADQGIVAKGCVVSPIPQEVVREFIKYIEEQEVAPLNQEIESLEGLGVEETNNVPNNVPEEKESDKKKGKAGVRSPETGSTKESSGKAITQRRIRSVPRNPGRKAQGNS